MQNVLQKNIADLLQTQNISLADLSRSSNVPYRTLQDIMAKKQAAKITTLAAIASGLGVGPGRLLENTEDMTIKERRDASPEEALEIIRKALSEKSPALPLIPDDIADDVGKLIRLLVDHKEIVRDVLAAAQGSVGIPDKAKGKSRLNKPS